MLQHRRQVIRPTGGTLGQNDLANRPQLPVTGILQTRIYRRGQPSRVQPGFLHQHDQNRLIGAKQIHH